MWDPSKKRKKAKQKTKISAARTIQNEVRIQGSIVSVTSVHIYFFECFEDHKVKRVKIVKVVTN